MAENLFAPEITSGGGGDVASLILAENIFNVMQIEASDGDAGQIPSFAVTGGADGTLFAIDPFSGLLSFRAAPNFEAPADSNHDNDYIVIVRTSDGALLDEQTLTITIVDAGEGPSITSDGGGAAASLTRSENATSVTTVEATVDLGRIAQFSVTGGADQALFAIDAATGVLRFLTAPNFEAPDDAGADNIYEVEVTASDGTLADTQIVQVAIGNINDRPAISSGGGGDEASVVIEEGNADVMQVAAHEEDAGHVPVFTITGGADQALFTINGLSGLLQFRSAPTSAAPQDRNGDNIYDVIVRASDGALHDEQVLHVTVGEPNEPPVITSDGGGDVASLLTSENATAVTIIQAADPNSGSTLGYSLVPGGDSVLFAIDVSSGALRFLQAPDFEHPADANGDGTYDVTARASDGTLFDEQVLSIAVTDGNEAPVITSPAEFSVSEYETAVGAVQAQDPDGGSSVSYSLDSGADSAHFLIDDQTGALRFAAPPDFEAPSDGDGNNVYLLTVRASDGQLTHAQTVTVTVTDAPDVASYTGTTGDDLFTAPDNRNWMLTGLAGIDTLTGNIGADTIDGGADDDFLYGQDGSDTLHGGSGKNHLDGGAGADHLFGGSGIDVYFVDNSGDETHEGPGAGNDLVVSTVSWTLDDNIERLRLLGNEALDAIGNSLDNAITGNAGANRLTGSGGHDRIWGAEGNDTLIGDSGQDWLDGGESDDEMRGGADNDTYLVDDSGDVVVELDGQGSDLVRASVSHTLGDFIEKLTLTGSDVLVATGNALGNLITGNDAGSGLAGLGGNDTIQGGLGNDVLVGGTGVDTLTGADGADWFVFAVAASTGRDVVRDFTPGVDRLVLDRAIFTGLTGATGEFVVGTRARTADQHLIYNPNNGVLSYDADGNGAGAAVAITALTGKPALTAADIWAFTGEPGDNWTWASENSSDFTLLYA